MLHLGRIVCLLNSLNLNPNIIYYGQTFITLILGQISLLHFLCFTHVQFLKGIAVSSVSSIVLYTESVLNK